VKFKPIQFIWKILNKPLFGTIVIPKDTSIDPTSFTEEDYPVYCTKCLYLLHGLEDGPCPECGTKFERGKLLVTQYLLYPWVIPFSKTRFRKVNFITGVLGFVLIGISICGILLSIFIAPSPVNPAVVNKALSNVEIYMYVFRIGLFVLGATIILHVVMLLCYVLYLRKIKIKRRSVRDTVIQILDEANQNLDQKN